MLALWSFADAVDKILIAVALISAMGGGVALPLFSILFGDLLDEMGSSSSTAAFASTIDEITVKILIVGAGAFVLGYLEVACLVTTSERQARRVRERYVTSILKQDMAFFDSTSPGELATRVSQDAASVQDAIGEKFGAAVRVISQFVAGFVIGFLEGWQLTLVLIGIAPFLAGAGACYTKLMQDANSTEQTAYAEAGSVADEVLRAIRTVVAFGAQDKSCGRYEQHLDKAERQGVRKGFLAGAGMGLTIFMMYLACGVAFMAGAFFIKADRDGVMDAYVQETGCPRLAEFSCAAAGNGTCFSECASRIVPCAVGDTCQSGGSVLTVFFATLMGAMFLGQAGPSASAVSKGREAMGRVLRAIARRPGIDSSLATGTRPAHARGHLRLEGVRFAYPSRPDVAVFDDLTLDIEPGATVALVGASGSGKSTTIQLLERYYDPLAGRVTLDGVDVRDLNLAWYRRQLGLVSQEPTLFDASIADNIAFGRPEATREEVEAAAKAANAHDFISALPEGYDTRVGQGGSMLSGGQKQRVAIARAIVRDPAVLLLDEATSALDSESERVVQAALDELLAGKERTTVVIAHRLSTIRNADKIVVFDHGRVVEQGSHSELLAVENGVYAQFVELQAGSGVWDAGDGRAADDGERDVVVEVERTESDGRLASRATSSSADRGTHQPGARKGSSPEAGDNGSPEAGGEHNLYKVSMMRIFRMSRPEWAHFTMAVVASSAIGVVYPMWAVAFAGMISAFFELNSERMIERTLEWALAFVGIAVGSFLAYVGQLGGFGVMSERLAKRLRARTFRAMLGQEIEWFDDPANAPGALTSRLATDPTLVQTAGATRAGLAVQNTTALVAGLTIAFVSSWQLTLIVFALFPLLGAAMALQVKSMAGFAADGAKATEGAGAVLSEGLAAMRTVTAFGLQEDIIARYSARLEGPQRAGFRRAQLGGVGFAASNFMMFFAYGVAYWAGGRLMADGQLSFEDVMRATMAILSAAEGAGESSQMAGDVGKARVAISRIFRLLDRSSRIDPYADAGWRNSNRVRGAIELRHVQFRYASRPDAPVFRDFSLRIEPGSMCALVGASGSGKSTVVSMLERFYDPAGGSLTLDGEPVSSMNVAWLRRQLGLVGQEPVLFDTSVIENIRYGKSDATLAEVEAAAKAANAHDFISALPEGYDTRVGQGGSMLSGGQKQRVAIARAIVRDPAVLLLDEATSALDSESERVVQAALDELLAGKERTTVVIAHRLSTIRNADKIVVVHEGRVVEQGSHSELLSMDGHYRKLWARQSMAEELNGEESGGRQ